MKGERVRIRAALAAVVGVLVIISSVMTGCAGNLALGDPRRMTFTPVEFTPPEPDRVVLENGMVVYLLQDHELPLISMTVTMRAGSWLDPADKIGLASLTGSIMRIGGGGGLSSEQVDEELEQLDRKSTRLNSSHHAISRMPSAA